MVYITEIYVAYVPLELTSQSPTLRTQYRMAQKATDKFSHKGAIKGIWSNA
jgi:hypothetical protein